MSLGQETIFLSDDKVFYTIEGEGEFVGYPSVFMRLSMCNLTCIGFKSEDAPYGCDSYISWSVKNKMTFSEIECMMNDQGYKEHLRNGAILKLTGGEPLIQQAKLLKFIDYLKQEWGFVPRIDFETNATLYPEDRWVTEFEATFTTSPKLRSNGDPKNKRYIEEVLDWHSMHNSGFKFVVQSRRDMDEIMTEYVDKFDIPPGRVWLMPCAGSRDEHIDVAADVAELAKEYHFNFSPRLHLLLWDMALKV
tara:strand:+ start:3972 stop:4718 length:747 start_codon:yes stop_codon:yes gene_type:complete